MRELALSIFISLGVHGAIFVPWTFEVLKDVNATSSASALNIVVMADVEEREVTKEKSNLVKPKTASHQGSAGVVLDKPQIIGELEPEYPWLSRVNGEEGSVELAFLVSSNGGAYNIEIVASSGFKRLDDAAMLAIKTAKFINKQDGASMNVNLNFKLREN